jgi:hypothetical protein
LRKIGHKKKVESYSVVIKGKNAKLFNEAGDDTRVWTSTKTETDIIYAKHFLGSSNGT